MSSLAPSPESVYDEPESPIRRTASPLPAPQQPDLGCPGGWRSTLSPEVYRSLSNHYGLAEMDRQELIHDLFTSEKTFVKSARHVICTYFVPLRARDSCTWLPGLPPDVARFFDWLEDIVNLHAAIARGLSTVVAIWKTGSIVLRVGGTLRAFVPQFEVYMPYLVKLESVRETLRWHVEKDGGELGEYLRMRDKESVQGEWALEQLLEQPAARLRQYLDMFQRLCELTQKEHPDHLAAISLLYATRMAVRVMDEVKAREDEYDFVKELASRIDGLSETAPLARRARRLLWYGTLLQTGMPPREEAHADSSGLGKEPRLLAVTGNENGLGRQPAQRMSQLVTAVRDWDARRSRGGSVSSYASSMASVQTTDTLSSASSILITPRSGQFFGISASARSGSVSNNGVKANGAREVPGQKAARDRTLNVMVFTDLIVLATPAQDEGDGDVRGESEREQRCHLLGGVGLSRILDVQEGADNIVSLDLVSISPDHLDTGFVGEDTSVVSITLALPAVDGDAATRQELVAALRKCHRHTIRSLSFPSLPGTMMEDVEIDTRQSLVGILSSGLPLPKSPSIQFDEAAKGERRDAIDGEREERGWWTLRFQQVLRELQREEVLDLVSVSSSSESEKAR
ncbi:Dbl homology domain-containing protein [Fomes fomentarius]|nr:Dbl homology domain-containing protein [Fomes fomentarius]